MYEENQKVRWISAQWRVQYPLARVRGKAILENQKVAEWGRNGGGKNFGFNVVPQQYNANLKMRSGRRGISILVKKM
jgi:hypothetical protein